MSAHRLQGWLVGLAAGSALGATSTLLLVDREPPADLPEVRVVEDVDFTIHHDAPDAVPGDYRVEKVVCDVDTFTAHAYCSDEEVTP